MNKAFYAIWLAFYTSFSFAGAPADECIAKKKDIQGVIIDYSEGWLLFSGDIKYGCTLNLRSGNNPPVEQKISNPVESADDKYLCDVARTVHIERDASIIDASYCDLSGNNARLISVRINKA